MDRSRISRSVIGCEVVEEGAVSVFVKRSTKKTDEWDWKKQ